MMPDKASIRCQPGFVLLFTTPVRAEGVETATLTQGLSPFDVAVSNTAKLWRDTAEAHVLGAEFLAAQRLRRHPLGRMTLPASASEPGHADVTLILHVAGVALWEVWLPAPEQFFDVDRWIAWLDAERSYSLAATVWAGLAPQVRAVSGHDSFGRYLAVSVLRLTEAPLETMLETESEAVVRLLWRDRQGRALKPDVVTLELARDTCARVGGLSLIGRRGAIDLHDCNDETTAEAARLGLAPRSLLPFLVTLEMLAIERAVLQGLHDRLTRVAPRTVDDLLRLRSDVANGLEEYYGTTMAGTRFGDEVSIQGEDILGITDLFDAVIDRLEMVSFTLTTHAEQRMTMLQFWLTVVFGATEIGFIASGIATWYYDSGLARVLFWTLGATGVSAAVLILALRNRLRD